ncbi:MAG TPA: M28 family peptidase [Nocardioides sp.]|uniref:M28 family metallopeptidase n=1 Tax=Nocardioides sp. TaxID=35761 RepID=UPI002D80E469|nr:M28 family peptidase [Nocardioides sp.]HET6652175.1 M28 family peptidase [Nocardioides sp.]
MDPGAARWWRAGAAAVALAVTLGCTADSDGSPDPSGSPSSAPSSSASPSQPSGTPSSPPTPSASASEPATEPPAPAEPVRFSGARANADVRHLAGRIGPRLATGPSYRRAADWVAARFRRLGYDVQRQTFPVPAGDSWGVPVGAGRSANVVATPPGFDASRPHRLVGAHLDTVAVAPGAEDNASGVAVVLELARLARSEEPALPTVFVAFGAEEPVGDGDALHHFGSKRYVATMTRPQRRALRAMAAFDRVGVGRVVPVCTGPLSPAVVQRQVLRTARRLGVPTTACGDNTTSDHWSFEKAGYPVARFGSIPYAGYHSAGDVPAVVAPAQLARTGRVAWAWLRS